MKMESVDQVSWLIFLDFDGLRYKQCGAADGGQTLKISEVFL
jgi:hypothetical protein